MTNIGFTKEERKLIEMYANDRSKRSTSLGFYALVIVPFIIYGVLGVIRRDFLPLLASLIGLLLFVYWRLSQELRVFEIHKSVFQKVLHHEKTMEATTPAFRMEIENTDMTNQLPFDEKLAASYVGKYVLVGLTYQDHLGNETKQEQMHGIIEAASRDGIRIALRGTRAGTTWNSPPLLDAIRPAKPGNYTLNSTNETIENPDLLCTWLITVPNPTKPKPS
jgi:hypothetical protein